MHTTNDEQKSTGEFCNTKDGGYLTHSATKDSLNSRSRKHEPAVLLTRHTAEHGSLSTRSIIVCGFITFVA